MAWYADLRPCDYFREPYDESLAVGWLEPTEPYSRGRADEAVVLKLTGIRDELGFSPMLFLGFHECSFCFTGEKEGDSEIPAGAHNLWIPGDGVIYVAPELVTHYVEAHDYLPPREFQQAVEECPLDPQRYANALVHAAPASMKESLAGALDSWLEILPELRAEEEERKKREFRWSWKNPLALGTNLRAEAWRVRARDSGIGGLGSAMGDQA